MEQSRHFLKVKSFNKPADYLVGVIASKLKSGRVLWLLSGGSSIKVAVEAAKRLSDYNLSRLVVSLADERFGPAEHADSNWRQLIDAGLRLDGAQLRPFLTGMSINQTVDTLKSFFSDAFSSDSYKIALLGMGDDGHTAGILPDSPAAGSNELVISYGDEKYQRITLGFGGLLKLDEAVIYAVGESKARQLERLAAENIDPLRQPAQIIKRLPRWTVYNDSRGEEI